MMYVSKGFRNTVVINTHPRSIPPLPDVTQCQGETIRGKLGGGVQEDSNAFTQTPDPLTQQLVNMY